MADKKEVDVYSSFEQRFNCLICWSPRLRMVFGLCQHRLCENCLYNSFGIRRIGLEKCPTCQMDSAFPLFKPSIPEDNIAIQRQLGVVECSNSGCEAEMWIWELDNHLSECGFSRVKSEQEQTPKKKKTKYSPAKTRSSGYNLRNTNKRYSPGKYDNMVRTRSSKRKLNSI